MNMNDDHHECPYYLCVIWTLTPIHTSGQTAGQRVCPPTELPLKRLKLFKEKREREGVHRLVSTQTVYVFMWDHKNTQKKLILQLELTRSSTILWTWCKETIGSRGETLTLFRENFNDEIYEWNKSLLFDWKSQMQNNAGAFRNVWTNEPVMNVIVTVWIITCSQRQYYNNISQYSSTGKALATNPTDLMTAWTVRERLTSER